MPAFLDTSALVKFFADETGSEEIRGLVSSEAPLWLSELAAVEGVSALARKVRNKEISSIDFRSLLRALMLFLASGRGKIVPLDDDGKERARRILSTWALSNRLSSLDALQLAAAIGARDHAGHIVSYTADPSLLTAAQSQRFTVRNPGVS
jgi:predicted nucleic acid-binding protein